jgi:Zn-dependent protease
MSLDVLLILFQIVVLVFAFTVHESAHAWAAMRLGDPTAYMLGRVSLNPAKHIDPWGSIVMPLVAALSGFPLLGWAKPCPVTLRNFKHVKRDDILTTFAGPLSNLLIATVAVVLLVVLKHMHFMGEDAVLSAMDMANRYPVDMQALPQAFPLALFLYYSILTNLLLFAFNLIPIPPLDGSRILRYFLPYNVEKVYDSIGNYGIILVFFFAGRLMMPIYRPLLTAFNTLIVKL